MRQRLKAFLILGSAFAAACAGPPPANNLDPADLTHFVGKLEGGIEHGEALILHIRARISEDGSYEIETSWSEDLAVRSIPLKLSGQISTSAEGSTYEDALSTGRVSTRMYGETLGLELEGTGRESGLPVLVILFPLEIGEYAYAPPISIPEVDRIVCSEGADWEAKATARYEELVKYGPMLGVVGAMIDIARTGGKLKEIDQEDADRIYERSMRQCLRNKGHHHVAAGSGGAR